MIRITYLSGGKLAKGEIASLNKIKSQAWVDCFNLNKQELKDLAEKTEIPEDDIKRALDEDERPSISEFETFSRITFHAPFKEDNHYTVKPFSIFVKKNLLIIVRNAFIESFQKFELLNAEKKAEVLSKDTTYAIYMILNEVVNHFFQVADEIEKEVDDIEKKTFNPKKDHIVQKTFNLKKTLIYFHKSLTGAREVIKGIEKKFLKHVKGVHTKKFRYLFNDVIQLIDMVDTYRDILTSSLDIHMTAVSNDMNAIMKRLTLITTFMLVPGLISGIYGMNFKYIPEIHVFMKWGYPFALTLMALSSLVVYLYFKKKSWF